MRKEERRRREEKKRGETVEERRRRKKKETAWPNTKESGEGENGRKEESGRDYGQRQTRGEKERVNKNIRKIGRIK